VTAFLVVVAVGAGSYLFRITMLAFGARSGLPPIVERAATYAVPISFAALAAAALADDLRTADAPVAPVLSVIVAIVAVRRTGSAHAALIAGMPTFWLLSALFA
jgi:branched-subunit amino acid transport protein